MIKYILTNTTAAFAIQETKAIETIFAAGAVFQIALT